MIFKVIVTLYLLSAPLVNGNPPETVKVLPTVYTTERACQDALIPAYERAVKDMIAPLPADARYMAFGHCEKQSEPQS